MTVIFMENCFQILEKNKILAKTENLCRPAPYQQWRKGAFFWYVKVYLFLLYKIQPHQNVPAFQIFSILKEIPSFSKIWKFWAFKLKLSQLSSSFSSCKYLLKFSSFKNFWYGPLQLLSNSQLQSQL